MHTEYNFLEAWSNIQAPGWLGITPLFIPSHLTSPLKWNPGNSIQN